MSETYTKLSSGLTESSVWTMEDSDTRIVWITLLSMTDADGFVRASIPGLAQRAVVSLEKTEHALSRFLAVDKYSRTPDNDGRRLEAIEGGWVVLNHALYRSRRDIEDRRTADRERKRREREKASGSVPTSPPPSEPVPVCPPLSAPSRDVTPSPPPSAHTDTEAEANTEAGQVHILSAQAPTGPKSPPKYSGKPKGVTLAEWDACKLVLGELDAHRLRIGVVQRATTTSATQSNCAHIVKRLREGVTASRLVLGVKASAWAIQSPDHPDKLNWLNAATPFRDDNWARRDGLIGEYEAAGGVVPARESGVVVSAGAYQSNKGAM